MKIRVRIQEHGYTLAGALTLLAILAIFMALAVPLWSRVKQRDNEEELIFRGKEYVKAIARYHAKFSTYPPDIETLVKLKFIRHEYLDPMTKSGKWKVLHPDYLVQTGAAGTINPQGDNSGAPGTGSDKKKPGQGLNSNLPPTGGGLGGDDDEEPQSQNTDKGLSSDDDKDKDEEPEVESTGPVVGVVSRSKKSGFKTFNGQTYYNKWVFVYALPQQPRPTPAPPGGGVQKPPAPGSQKPPGGAGPPTGTGTGNSGSGDDDDSGDSGDSGDQ